MATITFQHPLTGQLREAPVGFSGSTLLFGCFVPLLRSDWKWAGISFLLAIFTAGLSWLIFPFVYNKLYIKDLVGNGYKVQSVEGGTVQELASRLGVNLIPVA